MVMPDKGLVQKFLMASYLYYHHDISPMGDTEYDMLCKELLDNWDSVNHRHKRLLSKNDLLAGTGYAIPLKKYPLIVQSAAWQWYEEIKNGKDARQTISSNA